LNQGESGLVYFRNIVPNLSERPYMGEAVEDDHVSHSGISNK